MLIEGMPLWLAQTNAWIVAPDGPGGDCVLIDAPPDPAAIVSRLQHHGLRLVALLNTHGHIDHIGGVGTLVHESDHDIEVRIHDADKHMLLDPLGTSGMLRNYLEDLDLRPPEVIYGIDDGERIRGCGMTFTAIHTPGHTQGSVATREFAHVSRDPERTSGARVLQSLYRPLRYCRDGGGWQIHASRPRSDAPYRCSNLR